MIYPMPIKNAYDYSIRLLSKRDYSRFKLKQKLLQRDYLEEDIDNALEQLTAQRYLREDEYKRHKIKSLIEKGYANQLIQLRLEKEELFADEPLIEQIRGENNSEANEIVERLIQKKLRGKLIPKEPEEKMKLKSKVLNFLVSKGHNYQTIKDQVSDYFL
ncbi:MAG: regulatory protein RecX [Bacteriovoracaceae bacterium]